MPEQSTDRKYTDIEDADIENAVQNAKVMMQNANCYAESTALLEALDYYDKKASVEAQLKKAEATPAAEQEVTLNQIEANCAEDQEMFDVVADEADSAKFLERPSERESEKPSEMLSEKPSPVKEVC